MSDIATYITDGCKILGVENDICMGLYQLFFGTTWEQMHYFQLVPDFFCEEIMPYCDTDFYKPLNVTDFIDDILKDKPAKIQNDDYLQKIYETIDADPNPRKTIKVLHMTDIHPDLDYVVGSNANCDLNQKLICCRKESGLPPTPADAARPTGEYGCDVPYMVIEEMGKFIDKNLKSELEAVVWTGDA